MQAPYQIPGYGYEWFPSLLNDDAGIPTEALGSNSKTDDKVKELIETRKKLIRFVKTLHEKCQWSYSNIFLFGFSQVDCEASSLLNLSGWNRSDRFASTLDRRCAVRRMRSNFRLLAA